MKGMLIVTGVIVVMGEVPLSLERQGAGVLPKTIGYPDNKIEPPVTEAINSDK